jgi:hypothetical protein
MKRCFAFTAVVFACCLGSAQSQAPAPAAPQNPRRVLESIRETNSKLLEQQTKTLQTLEEMEKISQTLKSLGKRA